MASFIASLLQALDLIGLSLSVGGLGFILAVLHPVSTSGKGSPTRRATRLIILGALAVAGAEIGIVLTKAHGLAFEFGNWPWEALLASRFAQARVARAGLALLLAASASVTCRESAPPASWCVALLSSALLLVCGGWLAHAVSRLEREATLIAITVLHQVGAVLWVGGILHLLALRQVPSPSRTDAEVWPRALMRFSRFAKVSVVLLIVAGIALGVKYIGDWQNLVGTDYGIMVLTKATLLAVALGLASVNRRIIRRWSLGGKMQGVQEILPPLVEAEATLVLLALLSAVSLTTLPPAIDVAGQRATPAEVVGVLSPRWPQLTLPTPSGTLVSSTPAQDSFAPYTAEDRLESNFNHNISGLLVLLIAGVAILDRTGRVGWARHWPLLFVGLAVFLFLHAESLIWPFGNVGLWEQLADPAAIQHRLATLVVSLFALLEWRVQAGGLGGTRWRFAFPILAVLGSAILLSHPHTGLPTRYAFLIEVSHDILGLLAAFIGAGRWLELRLPPPGGHLGGILWRICLLGVGFVLLFYHE